MEEVNAFKLLVLIVLMLSALPGVSAFASWQENGIPVCTAANNQENAQITTDGCGGAILTWDDYRIAHGLAYDYVNAIAIDASGIKWFGTEAGASKFDGIGWNTYNTSNSGLADDHVYTVAVDPSGNKWFGTDSGASVHDGTLWNTYNASSSGLANNRVWAIAIDASSNKWFGTYGGGVSTMNFSGGWTTYNTSNSGLANDYVVAIAIDASGNKWFGTYGGGVSTFDGVAWTTYDMSNSGLASNHVWAIAIDAAGDKWFATDAGVSTFDGVAWTTYDMSNSGLANNDVQTVAIDASGNKWLGTFGGGVSRFDGVAWTTYDTSNSGLADDIVEAILIDASGNKWFATWSGVSKFDDIIWTTYNSSNTGGNRDIYAQRVDSQGVAKWNTDGAAVCTAAGNQEYPQIVPDGAGGAIIAWLDQRNGSWDIYAQRVDASGSVLWQEDGVAICTAAGDQRNYSITPDSAGGAIITWEDPRFGVEDIYVQRVNASGSAAWTPNGTIICAAIRWQSGPEAVSDGAGGAVIAWNDYRSGTNYCIYAQRVNGSGLPLWSVDGVAISTEPGSGTCPEIISDGTGGVIITWQETGVSGIELRGQRATASGVMLWGPDGVIISPTVWGGGDHVALVTDGAGGAVVAWDDRRPGPFTSDIYAQRVDYSGALLWPSEGVPIFTTTYAEWYPQLSSDGSGGAIVTQSAGRDVLAQRVGASGEMSWPKGGVAICSGMWAKGNSKITPDGVGGAIIGWEDCRNGDHSDIYAQRVTADGITDLMFAFSSAKVEGDHVSLSWRTTADVPTSSFVVKRSEAAEGDRVTLDVVIREEEASSFSSTDYSVQAGKTYWYWIVLVGASVEEVYGPIEVHVDAVPTVCAAYQNYPNPFNPLCTIRYDIPKAGRVSLTVFDVSGSLVRTLVNGWREPGVYGEIWDGKDAGGAPMPSGVYFYSLKSGDFVATRKMVLLR